MSDLPARHGNTVRAPTNCEQMWLSEVLFIENSHACTHSHTDTQPHPNTHLVTLKLGQCEPAKALLRWRDTGEKEDDCGGQRWGSLKTQIHLGAHVLARHTRGYGA